MGFLFALFYWLLGNSGTFLDIFRVGVGWGRNHTSQTIRPGVCIPIPVNNMLYKPLLPTPPLEILIQIHGNWVGVKNYFDSYPAPPLHPNEIWFIRVFEYPSLPILMRQKQVS